MWYVYIGRCADGSLYTGTTINPEQRIRTHNNKKGGNYTKVRTPVSLVYKEICASHSEALKREAQIKRWSRNKKLALIRSDEIGLIKLSKSRD